MRKIVQATGFFHWFLLTCLHFWSGKEVQQVVVSTGWSLFLISKNLTVLYLSSVSSSSPSFLVLCNILLQYQLPGSCRAIVGQLSGSCLAVLRQSSFIGADFMRLDLRDLYVNCQMYIRMYLPIVIHKWLAYVSCILNSMLFQVPTSQSTMSVTLS